MLVPRDDKDGQSSDRRDDSNGGSKAAILVGQETGLGGEGREINKSIGYRIYSDHHYSHRHCVYRPQALSETAFEP